MKTEQEKVRGTFDGPDRYCPTCGTARGFRHVSPCERFQVIKWQRGLYGIVDTRYPIGDPRRREGRGFTRKRDAEAYARRRNAEGEGR